MLKVRLASAAVLTPIVLSIFILGPAWLVMVFLAFTLAINMSEVLGMLLPASDRFFGAENPEELKFTIKNWDIKSHWIYVFSISLGVLCYFTILLDDKKAAGYTTILLAVIASIVVGMFSTRTVQLAAGRAIAMCVALLYGALPFVSIWYVYEFETNARYVLLIMFITWLGDTGGYFGGRFLGGKIFGDRKLAPHISPKKTWEGAVFSLASSVGGAFLLNSFYERPLAGPVLLVFIAVLGGVAAQIGDLAASTFKRFSQVKDSGFIIPGHGGLLDRIDGILFSAPVIWAILYYLKL